MKKQTAATIALAATLAFSAITANAATLKDVQQQDWYYTNVTNAMNKGIVNGYEDGTFRPNNCVTVGEAVKLTLAYKGLSLTNGYDHWASTWVTEASSLGYLEYGDFTHYDQEFNRQEVAKLVMRALGEADVDFDTSLIPDYNMIPDAYKPYVVQAYAKGIITGYEDGSFLGDKAISRAELMVVLDRAFDSSQRKTFDTSNRKSDIALIRNDIDVRVNGIHTARTTRVMQYKGELYIPCIYFTYKGADNPTGLNPKFADFYWAGVENDTRKWCRWGQSYTFQNAWQVSNSVGTAKIEGTYGSWVDTDQGVVESISHLQSLGLPVEYDAENRIVWIGEKELKFYGHTNGVLNSTPIVSYLQDPKNCVAGLGAFDGDGCFPVPQLGSIAFSSSNHNHNARDTFTDNPHMVICVTGCTSMTLDPNIRSTGTVKLQLFDAETGMCLLDGSDFYENKTIDLSGVNYIIVKHQDGFMQYRGINDTSLLIDVIDIH